MQFRRLSLLLLCLSVLPLAFAATAIATAPVAGFWAHVSGIPACVHAGQRVQLNFMVRNTVSRKETVIMRFPVITGADQEISFLAGTDPLSGTPGNKYWRFGLKPRQVISKHIVAVVKPPADQKASPPLWGLSVVITAKNILKVTKAFPVTTKYCTD